MPPLIAASDSENPANSVSKLDPPERRILTRRAANWRVLFGPNGDLSIGFLADMSPRGVKILSDRPLDTGTEIEVHFGVEEGQSAGKFQLHAVVRHCRGGKVGVEFVNVDPAQRDHWWKIMRGAF